MNTMINTTKNTFVQNNRQPEQNTGNINQVFVNFLFITSFKSMSISSLIKLHNEHNFC